MLTRFAATKRTFSKEGKYTFESKDSFPDPGYLPKKIDVLQRILHEDDWRTDKAALRVAGELREHWFKCDVVTNSKQSIQKKILKLTKEFNKAQNPTTKG